MAVALSGMDGVLTGMGLAVGFGMCGASFEVIYAPHAILSQISPIPSAMMDEPHTPFTDHAGIARKVWKSLCSGDMWMVAPEST